MTPTLPDLLALIQSATCPTPWLTVEQAASRVQVSNETIYAAMRAGELAHSDLSAARSGRTLRIHVICVGSHMRPEMTIGRASSSDRNRPDPAGSNWGHGSTTGYVAAVEAAERAPVVRLETVRRRRREDGREGGGEG